MRRGLFLVIFFIFIVGCSSPVRRAPSSFPYSQEVSFTHSLIKLLSIKTINEEAAYFFYFESKNQFNEPVEVGSDEISFKVGKERIVFDYFRDSLGKYYYRIFFKNFPSGTHGLKIYLGSELLSEIDLVHQNKLKTMDLAHSKMRVISQEKQFYDFELELIDSQGNWVLSTEKPEIIVEGEARVIELSPRGQGRWRGKLQTVDANTIVYLSLRLNSSYLPRLLRIQHIEK